MMRAIAVSICVLGLAVGSSLSAADSSGPLTMVVMDPLAKELSCPCVQGYAQRDYAKLAQWLSKRLGRPVEVVFSESLTKALKDEPQGRADIVIGKQSVVRHDAAKNGRTLVRTALLTGKDGATTQTGLIVVATDDPAKTPADLKGYRIVFGPSDCDEKNSAALALLKTHGATVSGELETAAGCDEGVTRILESTATPKGAAVISSYAKPLLEGCGQVPKGAIRIVGETEPVPFIAAFVAADLRPELRAKIAASLVLTATEPLLCHAIESKHGFAAVTDDATAGSAADSPTTAKKK